MTPLSPCSHCRHPGPSFAHKRGVTGKVTRARWYQETVACKNCRVQVTAGTPGNAVALWNRAYAGLQARVEVSA